MRPHRRISPVPKGGHASLDTLGLLADAPTAEVAGGHTQKIARFFRCQTPLFVLLMRILEAPHVRLP